MSKNVLQYVQSALNIMDSDLVDSIQETEESNQVAELLKDLYYELLERQEWEFLKRPLTLTAVGDTTQPTAFLVPNGMRRLYNVWYNVSDDATYKRRELKYQDPLCFVQTNGGSDGSNLLRVESGNGLSFYVRTDRAPSYWTSFDDNRIYCDAHDSSVETSLVTDKISAFGLYIPDFTVQDSFEPSIPRHMEPLLQHTLNASASANFKQQANGQEETRASRQMAAARRKNSVVAPREYYYSTNYGRR